jgi:hypothetical protein
LITTLGQGNKSPELLSSDFALANLTRAKAFPSAVMTRLLNLPHVGSRRSPLKEERNFWEGHFFNLSTSCTPLLYCTWALGKLNLCTAPFVPCSCLFLFGRLLLVEDELLRTFPIARSLPSTLAVQLIAAQAIQDGLLPFLQTEAQEVPSSHVRVDGGGTLWL